MKQRRAFFLVIDGGDGTGKDTQAKRLVDEATKRGLATQLFAYPDYATVVGQDITAYQRGDFGELASAHPKLVSYLYAVNRFETQAALTEALATQDLVVAARYVSSNVVYSSTRVTTSSRASFQAWVEQLDYEVLGNPREDAVIYLDLSIELADQLIAKRALGRRDINDENRVFRSDVRDTYVALAKARPTWHVVDCSSNGTVASIEAIGAQLDTLVFDRLIARKVGR